MSIAWNDSYKIGNPEVDQQHQHLFELTNQFITTEGIANMRALIIQLYKHTREHFEQEEALMRQVGFPGLTQHQENHNQFLRRLSELSMDVGKGYMNKPAIVNLMTEWATKHIPKEDAQVVAFMQPPTP